MIFLLSCSAMYFYRLYENGGIFVVFYYFDVVLVVYILVVTLVHLRLVFIA